MVRLHNAVSKMLPHLQIKPLSSNVVSEEEAVFIFSYSENILPLYEMLQKYGIKTEIDKVEERYQFLYILA